MTRVEQEEKTEERVSPQGKRILGIDRSTGLFMPIVSGSQVVLLSSSWRYAQVELDAISPYENPDLICQNTIISIVRSNGPVRGEFRLNGITKSCQFENQAITIIPEGDVGAWTCFDAHQTLFVSIKRDCFLELLLDMGLNDFRMPLNFSVNDDFMKSTMLQVFNEAAAGFPGGQIYGDSLVTALAAHLLTKHNLIDHTPMEIKGKLGQVTLRNVLERLKERHNTDIGLGELAEIANMSPYHFLRLFKETMGVTPRQYLIRYRLKRAKHLIASGETNLKEIARRVGFFDANHFKRHFKRIYHVSPSVFLRHMSESDLDDLDPDLPLV